MTQFVLLEGNHSMELPVDGTVWQYPMLGFLQWINDLTWTSEWAKYDIGGARPLKPKSR
jgi:hypothetical protein